MSEGAHGNRARIGERFWIAVPRWGEQDPSGTPSDPFPALSGSVRTQSLLSLFKILATKHRGASTTEHYHCSCWEAAFGSRRKAGLIRAQFIPILRGARIAALGTELRIPYCDSPVANLKPANKKKHPNPVSTHRRARK